MILLDTNVVSELMRREPDARVLAWAASRPLEEMAVAAVTVMEIRVGIEMMPDGRRRSELDARFNSFLAQGFEDRVLVFDRAAAEACASIRAIRRRLGKPISTEDSMIAAIATVRGAAIATRDSAGFAGCSLILVNPWGT